MQANDLISREETAKRLEALAEQRKGSFSGEAFEFAAKVVRGVPTAVQWIPVSERLPKIPKNWCEHPDPVLYMMKSTHTIYAGYYGEGGKLRDKYFRQYHDGLEGVDADDVLCWMWQHDLPEPPKGE